mgnify:CR=1 FL=1
MKFWKRKEDDAQIEITPLIDMVFLLIIFFLISTTMDNNKKIEVDIPSSETGVENKSSSMDIFLTKNNIIIINDSQYTIGDFQTFMQNIDISQVKTILLNGDKMVDLQFLVNVMDIIRKRGIENISLGVKSY